MFLYGSRHLIIWHPTNLGFWPWAKELFLHIAVAHEPCKLPFWIPSLYCCCTIKMLGLQTGCHSCECSYEACSKSPSKDGLLMQVSSNRSYKAEEQAYTPRSAQWKLRPCSLPSSSLASMLPSRVQITPSIRRVCKCSMPRRRESFPPAPSLPPYTAHCPPVPPNLNPQQPHWCSGAPG